MKGDIESIRDKIDQRPAETAATDQKTSGQDRQKMFQSIDLAWNRLVAALIKKFEYVDARSVGSYAYSFAHGNRKGPKLTYDQADAIGRLQSSIKSFRRRRGDLSSWLTPDVCKEFVDQADTITAAIERI